MQHYRTHIDRIFRRLDGDVQSAGLGNFPRQYVLGGFTRELNVPDVYIYVPEQYRQALVNHLVAHCRTVEYVNFSVIGALADRSHL